MTNNDMESRIRDAVRKALSETSEFSNVARPKATKASTATQGAWKIENEPKASAATEGAWDATDTPGGVSSNAKKVWTKDEIAKEVAKVLLANPQFFNRPIENPPAKPSASTQVVTGAVERTGKPSSATRAAWDSTDTPGGVSSETKKIWNFDAIEQEVRKVVLNNAQFFNKPIDPPTKPSASTQAATGAVEPRGGAVSASTQPAWLTADDETKRKVSASTCAQILTNVYKLK